MSEQSHREEMSAAIRAQRERRAAPRSIAPEPPPEQTKEQTKEPETERKKLLGRRRGK